MQAQPPIAPLAGDNGGCLAGDCTPQRPQNSSHARPPKVSLAMTASSARSRAYIVQRVVQGVLIEELPDQPVGRGHRRDDPPFAADRACRAAVSVGMIPIAHGLRYHRWPVRRDRANFVVPARPPISPASASRSLKGATGGNQRTGAWVRRFDLPPGRRATLPARYSHLVRARGLPRNSPREGLEQAPPRLAPIGGRISVLGGRRTSCNE